MDPLIQTAIRRRWTPEAAGLRPWLDIDTDTAIWSGSNLSSIRNKGFGATGAVTLSTTVPKGTVAQGRDSMALTSGVYLNLPMAAFGTSEWMFVWAALRPRSGTFGGVLNNSDWQPGSGHGTYGSDGSVEWSAASGYNIYPGNGGSTGPGWHGGTAISTTTFHTKGWLYGTTVSSWNDSAAVTLGGVAPSGTWTGAVPNYGATTWKVGEVGGGETIDADLYRLLVLTYQPSRGTRERLEAFGSHKYNRGANLPTASQFRNWPPMLTAADDAWLREHFHAVPANDFQEHKGVWMPPPRRLIVPGWREAA